MKEELNQETIQNLSALSRIHCEEKEQLELLEKLKKILHYVEKLQDLDTENVAPCNHVLAGLCNVMRDDVADNNLPRETFLKNAPSQIGGLIRVPTVIRSK